ncbi:2-oxo acid dehydrogenase subunit E2 [Streptomyces sclerotialus]|uniref:2-oxo acid dehydrogenase subunit E2 n=1 Tax=Streptomyces sclerotialus TaxID=1957 RepID=UPI0004C97B8E
MIEITVPKLNNNDAAYDLIEWLVADGATVSKDDDLVTVETSKAAEDLVSEHDGVLLHVVPAGTQVTPGTVVARVFPGEAERKAFLAEAAEAAEAGGRSGSGDSGAGFILTDSARRLATELAVTDAELASLGKRIIKGSDVEEITSRRDAPAEPDESRLELSQHQRAISAVVSESHRTVPASFTVVRIRTDAAEAAARAASERSGTAVGLTELLIAELAGLRRTFPAFFGRYHDSGHVVLADASHIGVTVDLGSGLYIPVVRDADRKSVDEIADQLGDFRFSALRGSFRSSELTDAAITLSLNNDEDVILTQPIVFPGQTCMLSLGGTQQALDLTEDGELTRTSYVYLGLAFDHRVINGREAVAFLRSLKSALEEPEQATAGPAQGS